MTEKPQGVMGSRGHDLMLLLKRNGECSLTNLSTLLKISKVAALKHVRELENAGLIQRKSVPHKRGRPELYISLTEAGEDIFPKSYSDIALETLDYVNLHLGREHVGKILNLRAQKLIDPYSEALGASSGRERVERLATARERDGYMAQWKQLPGSTFEIVEFNCPLMAISSKYSEACTAENNLFTLLMDSKVVSTHRMVDGHKGCRFLIDMKNSRFMRRF